MPTGKIFFFVPNNREAKHTELKLSRLNEKQIFEDENCTVYGFNSLEEYHTLIDVIGDE